ncbi:MAG: type II toxin-antitoxin system VapC family toxin [Candidatus Brocadiia bacterium]
MFLDTSFCVDLMREQRRGTQGPASAKLRELGDTPLLASVFVLCELQAGARLSQRPRRELRKIAMLAERLTVVYPDAALPVSYGELEAHLRRQATPIPTMDLLIGATAKLHGLALLTRDVGHYALIPGLVVESY